MTDRALEQRISALERAAAEAGWVDFGWLTISPASGADGAGRDPRPLTDGDAVPRTPVSEGMSTQPPEGKEKP